MTREYTLTTEISDTQRVIEEGVTRDQYNVTITKVETGQAIQILNTVSYYDRDQWCKSVFENAKIGLDDPDGPSCCYVNASYVT